VRKLALVALGLCAFAPRVHAGPADYVYLPAVSYGEKEIDFKAGTAKDGAGDRESAASLGFGWGAAPSWWTELYGKWHKLPGESTQFDAYEWENKFQLTEPGQYAVDVGLITEIEITKLSADPNELKIGPLFQTESGKMQYNLNFLFERTFGGELPPDESHKTEMGYQWQVKYRQRAEFEFGAQGFGQMGEWNTWDARQAQFHNLGPAVFGKFDLGQRRKIRYNAAWLFGVTEATPDHTLRMQLEYEF
jgi:hypothetical protein